jgi:hypothetical protein
VGSHSHTHPNIFSELSPAKMAEEWRTSCDRLSQVLGAPCNIASLPGGDQSAAVFRSAHQAGIQWLFTSEPMLTPQKVGDCWIVGRVCSKRDTPSKQVQALAEFRGWQRALWIRRSEVLLRKLLAPAYRAGVRMLASER